MNALGKLLIVIPLLVAGCARSSYPSVVVVPRTCDRHAPSSLEPVAFRATVVRVEQAAWHVDFDGFSTDYDALVVRFEGPEAWKGMEDRAYHQGEPVLAKERVMVGSIIEFSAKPPRCLDQPWLFLSKMEPVKKAAR